MSEDKTKVPTEIPGNVRLANGYVTSATNLQSTKALVDHGNLDSLVGQLMQYIEATYTDKEQRDAHKSIVKSICREWLVDIYSWEKGWKVEFDVNPDPDSSELPQADWTYQYTIGS